MDTLLEQLELQPLLRYDGEERRRRALVEWANLDHRVERRVMDPPTEQDHPEVFGPN